MMLSALIFVLVVGGVLAWIGERWHRDAPRWIALLATLIELALAIALWLQHPGEVVPTAHGAWLAETSVAWIPRFGISYHLALDGISLLLVALTALLGVVSVACSWREIQSGIGFFHLNLCLTLAGAVGVFLALDLFLFFFLWELMLVPMYFLIAIWGHERRRYASIKFFIFTQGSGLLMLLSILALAFVHHGATGSFSFDYFDLLHTAMAPQTQMWVMLGFFVAFAVKLPAFPLHTWLPDAHTEAPTAGSVILAGVLLKTGAYGLLRFVVPLFPDAAMRFAPVAMALGVAGILYGALLAFAQSDLKRLIAYTSVSHLGFVLLAVFAWNAWALNGAVMQMLAHGVSTGALFILVGLLQERIHTRDMQRMGGLWATVPRLAAIGLFFVLASLGLPSTSNFVGEFLVLLGSYRVNLTLTVLATLGLITAVVYALALMQRTFHGDNRNGWQLVDASSRELATFAVLIAVTIWLGLYPQPVFDVSTPALRALQATAVVAEAAK
ncbi:MAG: NADH-quinone oxidoreductase subunit M [Ideonella sp.]|nr:NADH-quinone oxidoreductase subunit M [Ideonella sp.]